MFPSAICTAGSNFQLLLDIGDLFLFPVKQMPRTAVVEVEGSIGIVKLNRPEKLNAINMEMVADLVLAFDELDGNRSVKAVIVTGNGKAFSAGADVREMSQMPLAELVREGHMPLWNRLRTFRKPIIAALNGITAGGGLELAMACDIAIASRSAKIGQTETNLGIIPGAGGTQRLTRSVGKQKAMEMVLTGELISAEEASDIGLILKAVDDVHLMDEARAIAVKICSRPLFAVELAKESVNRAFETTLQQGLDFERRNFYLSIEHEDGKEGMKAFLEKRKPEWNE